MLQINKILSRNQKGFSLIELMVAVVIMAFAAFGIFQAFSTGFQGMTESKARTVATNFVQEKMEELKNKDFDEVVDESSETITSGGVTFSRSINVDFIVGSTNLISADPTNIKRIITTVGWELHGKSQTVESQLVIQKTQFTPGSANRILLYADPYNVVLPVTDSTRIIAVIKDTNGNTVTSWDGSNVTFSIINTVIKGGGTGTLGTLSDYSVAPVNGIASVTFTSTGTSDDALEGTVTVQASVIKPDTTVLYDTIDIIVTWGAVKIEVTADPTSILANGTSQSTITAKIVNAGGNIVPGTGYNVTFSVLGEGTLLGETTVTETDGIATIQLQSTTTPGIATVTASSPDLFSGSCDVQTSGVPAGISIKAKPAQIYEDDTAEIEVTIVDVNGVPVIPTTTIDVFLSITGGGTLNDYLLSFNGVNTQKTIYTPLPTTEETNVEIIASTNGWDDSVIVKVMPKLIPDHIVLQADPDSIPVGGGSPGPAKITAIVKDINGITVHNYSGSITFETDLGTFTFSDSAIETVNCNQGIAIVYLESGSLPGWATVTAETYDSYALYSLIQVGFYSIAHHIKLMADPIEIPVGGGSAGTSILTAVIEDIYNIKVNNYNGMIYFSFYDGFNSTAKFKWVSNENFEVSIFNGEASADILSLQNSGPAGMRAEVLADSSLGDATEIIYVQKVLRETIPASVEYTANERGVTFTIEVAGGNMQINDMMVSWSPDTSGAILNSVLLNGSEVYSGNILNGELIDIVNTVLPEGVSSVMLNFNTDIGDESITVTFYPEGSPEQKSSYTVDI